MSYVINRNLILNRARAAVLLHRGNRKSGFTMRRKAQIVGWRIKLHEDEVA